MQAWLISLYPKEWRKQYGDEYAALLDDVGLSPQVVLDTIKAAFLANCNYYQKIIASSIAIVLYVVSGCFCLRFGLTDNWPFWAPTRPDRAIGLIITLTPLLVMAHMWLPPIYQKLRQNHGQTRAALRFLAILPLSLTTIFATALTGGSLLLSLGLVSLGLSVSNPAPPEIHAWGNMHVVGLTMVRLTLAFGIFPVGLLMIKVLLAIHKRLLIRLAS